MVIDLYSGHLYCIVMGGESMVIIVKARVCLTAARILCAICICVHGTRL